MLVVFSISCNQAEEGVSEAGIEEYTIIGLTELVELESGFYTGGGGAHPTLFGEVHEYTGLTYKKAVWENGEVMTESGTISFSSNEPIIDHVNQTITYTHTITFHPTVHNPSNCGQL